MNVILHHKYNSTRVAQKPRSTRCAWRCGREALPHATIHCQFTDMKRKTLCSNVLPRYHEISEREQSAYLLPSVFLASSILATCDPVFASMDASYSPEQGSETFKNIAGVGYIILVIFYFFRLFTKRAEKAASEPLASTAQTTVEEQDDLSSLDNTEESSAPEDVTVVQCLIGVAQAGAICFLCYLLSTVVDDYFAHQDLPSQYTARNITLLIQSVVRGLVYLITFIFGANATGLAALAVQLVVDPDGVDKGLDTPMKKKELLPKVKVTDDMGSIKRAFKEAERMGKKESKE